MRNLWHAALAAAVLTAALAVGAARNKSAADAARYETATLAGGCFWGLQESLRQLSGVVKTTAGYTGGTTANPTYELVAAGKTGHREAVEVVFDPNRLSYEELLADFLTARIPARLATGTNSLHPPTIFYHSEEQRQAAGRVRENINRSGNWGAPFIAEIQPATKFYPAEEYHQDYFQKNSAGRLLRGCGETIEF